jgi:hypothetical protein
MMDNLSEKAYQHNTVLPPPGKEEEIFTQQLANIRQKFMTTFFVKYLRAFWRRRQTAFLSILLIFVILSCSTLRIAFLSDKIN